MRGCIFEVNHEGIGWWLTICFFTILLILTWELRYSFKKKCSRKWGLWFWKSGYKHLCTSVLGVEVGLKEISCRACLLFYCFFWWQNMALKNSLALFFHPLIINSLDLPSYSSELRKRYILRVLMCLEVLGEGFSWGWLGGVSHILATSV